MTDARAEFSKLAFTKTFVLPALLVFLIPVISWLFFRHAQASFDRQAREEMVKQIQADPNVNEEEREKAIAFFTKVPFSQLIQNPDFAANVERGVRSDYATFRWMIRLSAWSVISGIAVIVATGVCVLFSLRSQYAQYLSLLISWQVLRIFGAFQAIVQAILIVALSFWVTALWFEVYVVKLILIAAVLAIAGVVVVIMGIFKKPDMTFHVEGTVIKPDDEHPLWGELRRLCDAVGTAPVDQVVAGIDDNFFVTETPVTINGKTYDGRTLFVSLSLLKQLEGSEAEAVLAHEMAHFSGQDTLYTKKISPLLNRYYSYLQILYENGITRPFFYLMHCFLQLFQLSLNRLSRHREFRADRISAEATSPRAVAGALLRIAAYSKYRHTVENELFQHEQVLESADVANRIEQGFPAYAVTFASDPDTSEQMTAHPFDSHPPLAQRLAAIEVPYAPEDAQTFLENPGDGRWYEHIRGAAEMERAQWDAYEERFRKFHEQTLPYRFLPETDEERALVEKAFPAVSFDGKKVGVVTISYDSVDVDNWEGAIAFTDISKCAMTNENVLQIFLKTPGERMRTIKVGKFPKDVQAPFLDAFNKYYSRYLAAVAYQQQKQAEQASAPN